MSKVVSFCESLLSKARDRHGDPDQFFSIENESSVLDTVLEIIEDVINGNQDIEEEATLDTETDEYCENEDQRISNEDVGEECSENSTMQLSSGSQDWEEDIISQHGFSLETMKAIVEFYDKCKKKKLAQTTARWRHVTTRAQISSFKTTIETNGTRWNKLKIVQEFVLSKFRNARQNLLSLHDQDLKRWGINKAKELDLNFAASDKWVRIFKTRNRIVSRKITKIVSKRQILDEDKVRKSGDEFVIMVRQECLGVPSSSIFNFDQSGFSYEFQPTRTLSIKGEKSTFGVVRNMNAGTHSYTVMPLISMNGKLRGKLLICLQEPSGKLGPRVEKNLKVPGNVFLQCSKSGKLDKGIMKKWIDNVLKNVCEEEDNVVIIYDSWAGHADPTLYESIGNISRQFKIPPHTTCNVQPLDRYFFRQYKLIMRALRNRIMLENLDIDMHARQTIININSLVFNQLCSDKFDAMLRYPWYACNYVIERPGKFDNVNEILFDTKFEICDIDDCSTDAFLRCSYCSHLLCCDHFLKSFHYH